ncbi:MAG: type II CAAX prenyl endopeptidase Rce1 family protein [Thermoanaerobaculia bacterium]
MVRSDARFLALCLIVAAVSIAIIAWGFDDTFPEASIDFQVDRDGSRELAADFLERIGIGTGFAKSSSRFGWDGGAKVFLERNLDPARLEVTLRNDVEIWYWQHRWFTPLEVRQVRVDVSPTGRIVAFELIVPEDEEGRPITAEHARARALEFLSSMDVGAEDLEPGALATRQLPNRVDTTVSFESKRVRPGGAPYRHAVTFHGERIAGYRQYLDVPDSWIREYTELRSKNQAAGAVDSILILITVLAALVVFISRLRRDDVAVRFTSSTAIVGGVLVLLVALNSWPAAVSSYDPETSWNAFVTQQLLFSLIQAFTLGVFLLVVTGSGEALYRERLPHQLAMPRLFRRDALRSKRVVLGLVLGYTLVPAFIAYQTLFYRTAARFGAWSPAEVPYDDILSSAFPWAAVLFMGFFPAVSEEFLSRAFSIPFFERILRSRVTAIVAAGFIWGFGHAAYPNQPFWIRGVEVGLAGVVIGFLMLRFGLLPLLIWHYTVDAVYTALLLFQSGNTYYIASAAVASLVFLLPLILALALAVRHRGFRPDDDLTNAAIGSAPARPAEPRTRTPLEGEERVTPRRVVTASILIAVAAVAWSIRPPLIDDVAVWPISQEEAAEIATRHLGGAQPGFAGKRVVTVTARGFRSWNERGGNVEGGTPGGYARIAAEEIVETTGVDRLLATQRDEVEAATWVVRFFEPLVKEEMRVEIDPRTRQAVGHHRQLDESAAGERLDRISALALARAELARYGLVPDEFELKEAIPIEQPARLDWLLHFDERELIVPGVGRRASVRLAGSEATQFAKTVQTAERLVVRESRRTLVQTFLLILQLAGILGIIALLAHGFVAGARVNGIHLRFGIRAALLAAPLGLAVAALRAPGIASFYDTAIAWETFLVGAGTELVLGVAAQLGLILVAGILIETANPAAVSAFGSDGRRRYGRAAAVAALALAPAVALIGLGLDLIPRLAPSALPIPIVGIPGWTDSPFPLAGLLWSAVVTGFVAAAAASAIGASIRETGRPRIVLLIAALVLTTAQLDPSANGLEIPGSIFFAAVLAAVALYGSRHLLKTNPLSWSAAPFAAVLLLSAIPLLLSQRPGIVAHGVAAIAVAFAFTAFLVRPRTRIF